MLKNTKNLTGYSPAALARITESLAFIARFAEATSSALWSRYHDGIPENDEALMRETRQLNEELAGYDGRDPHPGV